MHRRRQGRGARNASFCQRIVTESGPSAASIPAATSSATTSAPSEKLDPDERRDLSDVSGGQSFGLDPHRPRDHLPVPLLQLGQVVDAVHQRHHSGFSDDVRRRESERAFELGRLGSHPEDLDALGEGRRSAHGHLEVAEHGALDGQHPAVRRRRLRSRRQDDVVAGLGECPADQPSDAADAKDGVPHAGSLSTSSARNTRIRAAVRRLGRGWCRCGRRGSGGRGGCATPGRRHRPGGPASGRGS